MFPFASFATATSFVRLPTFTVVLGDGVTVRLEMGTVTTVTYAVSLLPFISNVTAALPTASACTTPVEETLATEGTVEFHLPDELLKPVMSRPCLSYAWNVSCCDCPTRMFIDSGNSASLAIGACTTTVAVSVERRDAATIIVAPIDRPVTIPLFDTGATFGSRLCQVIGVPGGSGFWRVSCCCSSRPRLTRFVLNDSRASAILGSAGPVGSQATAATIARNAVVRVSARMQRPPRVRQPGQLGNAPPCGVAVAPRLCGPGVRRVGLCHTRRRVRSSGHFL